MDISWNYLKSPWSVIVKKNKKSSYRVSGDIVTLLLNPVWFGPLSVKKTQLTVKCTGDQFVSQQDTACKGRLDGD